MNKNIKNRLLKVAGDLANKNKSIVEQLEEARQDRKLILEKH